MAIDGSSEDIGSWKTIPIRAPLRLRKPDGVSCVTSLPSKRIEPSVRWIETEYCARRQRFTASGFTDYSHYFTRVDGKSDAFDQAPTIRKPERQVGDFE
jgi:hypothetical protein